MPLNAYDWVDGEPPSHPYVSKRSVASESCSWEFRVNKLQWIYNFTIYRKNKYNTSAFTLLKLILQDIVTVSRTSSIKPKMDGKIFSFSVEWCNPDEPRCNLTSYDWVASVVVKRRVGGFDDRKHGFSLNKGTKVTMVCKILGSQQLSCNNDRDGNGKKANVLGSVSTEVGDPR